VTNPFTSPAAPTVSPKTRGGRRSETVGRRFSDGQETDHRPPLFIGDGASVTLLTQTHTPKIPAWVTQTAQTQNPARTSTTATLTACPRCTTPTLTAIDSWDEAHTATIDPTHLTPAEELHALRTGRPTYELHPSQWSAPTIKRRTRWTITANRARPIVTPIHKCGEPLGQPIPWQIIYQPGKGPHHDNQPAPF
jgi:hypothetical protein